MTFSFYDRFTIVSNNISKNLFNVKLETVCVCKTNLTRLKQDAAGILPLHSAAL